VLFDSVLSMDAHVSSVVRATSFDLRNIGIVCKQLTDDATKLLVQSMVLSIGWTIVTAVRKVCQKHHLTVCNWCKIMQLVL
jgi:hypothetical protein